MIRVSLDLEMNQEPTGGTPIIQVGACIFNSETGEIIDKFDQYVKSKTIITPYINNLCGIHQRHIDAAQELNRVYWDFVEFMQKHPKCIRQLVTWGGGDRAELKKQLIDWYVDNEGCYIEELWKLGYTEMNVKNIHQYLREKEGKSTQGGLARSMLKYGLQFEGTKHNALDDSINTAKIYCHMLNHVDIKKLLS